jgi:dienelactone hydrolase
MPAAGLILLIFLSNFRRLVKPNSINQNKKNGLLIIRGLFAFVLIIGAGIFPTLFTMNMVAPSGPFSVGTHTYHFVDNQRMETYGDDPAANREIMVQVWYPTDQLNTEDNFDQLDAPISEYQETYPVIIFSHGGTGIRIQNQSAMLELASHGYIVASIDHTYLNIYTYFPGKGVILMSPKYNEILQQALKGDVNADAGMKEALEVRVEDIRFTIQQLQQINGSTNTEIITGAMDLTRVGVFGHSMGGATAGQFCREDNLCKAVIVLDGTLTGDLVETNSESVEYNLVDEPFLQPIMFINSGLYYDPVYASGYKSNLAAFENATEDAYNLVLADSEHMNMTDVPTLISPVLMSLVGEQQMHAGTIDPQICIQTVNTYILNFMDHYLKGLDTPILNGPSSSFPFVEFESNLR